MKIRINLFAQSPKFSIPCDARALGLRGESTENRLLLQPQAGMKSNSTLIAVQFGASRERLRRRLKKRTPGRAGLVRRYTRHAFLSQGLGVAPSRDCRVCALSLNLLVVLEFLQLEVLLPTKLGYLLLYYSP